MMNIIVGGCGKLGTHAKYVEADNQTCAKAFGLFSNTKLTRQTNKCGRGAEDKNIRHRTKLWDNTTCCCKTNNNSDVGIKHRLFCKMGLIKKNMHLQTEPRSHTNNCPSVAFSHCSNSLSVIGAGSPVLCPSFSHCSNSLSQVGHR